MTLFLGAAPLSETNRETAERVYNLLVQAYKKNNKGLDHDQLYTRAREICNNDDSYFAQILLILVDYKIIKANYKKKVYTPLCFATFLE